VFYMARYSDEFKLKVVREYIESPLGYKRLAKKYKIPSTTPIKRWVKAYQRFGMKGIRNNHSRQAYSFQFKLDVLDFRKRTGASYQETALKFNMTQPGLISKWNAIYVKEGLEGLKGSMKGCPPMSKKDKSKTVKKKKRMTREEVLERENELLRLENSYLKKLKAFQENPNAYLEKHKQRWHSNSKKKDLD